MLRWVALRMQVADQTRRIEEEPDAVDAYLRRALARAELGAVRAALSDCATAIARHPASVEAYVTRAEVLLSSRNPRACLADCDRALKIDPTRAAAHALRARGRLALGTWQGLFLAEHRTSPDRRRLVVHVLGEP